MKPAAPRPTAIFIVAGEPSGDVLGARLMRAMRKRSPVPLRFVGIGGEGMRAEGLEILFPLSDIAVMGIGEVLPRLPRILRRLREAASSAVALRPAAVVTIDSSSFNKRLARRLLGASLPAPRIHYVAPMVWAWRPGRAKVMAAHFDHLLALLPFEVEPFREAGLPTTWTGHPVVETEKGDRSGFRRRHGIVSEARVVCVLPGSRMMEIIRLLPVFRDAVGRLADSVGPIHTIVPTVETVESAVLEAARNWPTDVTVVRDSGEKPSAFAASDVALAASGSVTLELAAAEVPMVVAYRASRLTAFLAPRLLTLQHIALVNILAGCGVVPEILQDQCTPERLARALEGLLLDPAARTEQLSAFRSICEALAPGGPLTPSERAADVVLSLAFPDPATQSRDNRQLRVTRDE